jgi:hypothetical protein
VVKVTSADKLVALDLQIPIFPWPFGTLKSALLERLSLMAFSNATNVDARYSLYQEIHGDLVISHEQEGTRAKQIYRWLAAPDPSCNQEDADEKRLESASGMWLIQGKQFSRWKNNPNSFLLLYGIRMFRRDHYRIAS